ncbi:Fe2OG dioxygenase domain-containing protein [Mycena kentingensis (nom. inval.)]|nr:Fe2OG dioxygenase domain-containing protein [Mycena kentingensis (nom. inval.)]
MPPRFTTTYDQLDAQQLRDALSAFSIAEPADSSAADLKSILKAHLEAHPEYMENADFVELYPKVALADSTSSATTASPTSTRAIDQIEVLRESLTKSTPYTSGVLEVKSEELGLFYKSENEARVITFGNASDGELASLAAACQPATFGRNTEDVYDESYRKAGKMDNSTFASTLNFATLQDVMESVTPELLDGQDGAEDKMIRAELYKLNVYGPGSFFKEHKDTPRSEDMIGSLVIVFPTQHAGGALTLAHGTQSWKFDSAADLAGKPTSIAYVAFFSDVMHAVEEVTAGYRVTITYNLFLAARPAAGLAPSRLPSSAERECVAALRAILADKTFLPTGGLLGFGLTHQYPIPRSPDDPAPLGRVTRILKGSDARMHTAAAHVGLEARVRFLYDEVDRYKDANNVLLDRVPKLQDGHGWEDCGPEETVELNSEGEEETPDDGKKRTAIFWVTELLLLNEAKSGFAAMGNEACLAHEYGHAALFVRIPPASQR